MSELYPSKSEKHAFIAGFAYGRRYEADGMLGPALSDQDISKDWIRGSAVYNEIKSWQACAKRVIATVAQAAVPNVKTAPELEPRESGCGNGLLRVNETVKHPCYVIEYAGGYWSADQGRVRHITDAQLYSLKEMAQEVVDGLMSDSCVIKPVLIECVKDE